MTPNCCAANGKVIVQRRLLLLVWIPLLSDLIRPRGVSAPQVYCRRTHMITKHSLDFFAPILRIFSRPEGYEAFTLQGADHEDDCAGCAGGASASAVSVSATS